MAKRRTKKRTHAGANPNKGPQPINTGNASIRNPKSMVIRIGAGEVGSSVSQLVSDVRRVMEPGTASRLKERRANKLRDYTAMCGPLGVTQLLLFSRSESGNVNLRLGMPPRGPTFNFRVEKYSLAKDVQRAQRRPKGAGKEFISPPLLVMNNFISTAESKSAVPKHLESLATTVFQGLFPPINPQTTPLKSLRRVLLLNREQSAEDDGSFILNFRHYAITTKTTGISKPLKRLNAAEKLVNSKKSKKGGLPNLGKLQDIADFMIGGDNGEGYMTDGATSGSEADTDAEVEILETSRRKVLSAKARAAAAAAEEEDEPKNALPTTEDNVERRAVKLVELGPRMRLRLTKVEEGLCDGKVLWHEYIHKSQQEVRELDAKWDTKRKAKEARRKQQKENIEKKLEARKASGAKNGGKNGAEDDEDDDEMDVDAIDSDAYSAFDSDGLAGDAEMLVNEKAEQDGEWEDEEEEIAGRR